MSTDTSVAILIEVFYENKNILNSLKKLDYPHGCTVKDEIRSEISKYDSAFKIKRITYEDDLFKKQIDLTDDHLIFTPTSFQVIVEKVIFYIYFILKTNNYCNV